MNKKTRLILLLTGFVILLIGGGLTSLIRCVITKFDLIAFFSSKTAMIIYFLAIMYGLFTIFVFLKFKE